MALLLHKSTAEHIQGKKKQKTAKAERIMYPKPNTALWKDLVKSLLTSFLEGPNRPCFRNTAWFTSGRGENEGFFHKL